MTLGLPSVDDHGRAWQTTEGRGGAAYRTLEAGYVVSRAGVYAEKTFAARQTDGVSLVYAVPVDIRPSTDRARDERRFR